MSKKTWLVLVVLACAAYGAFAQVKGQAKGKDKAKGASDASVSTLRHVFSDADRRMILDHYNPGGRGLPPGLAKRSDLPPGLEKQLRRNGKLPPGLDQKIDPFPLELERRFPPLCSGCRRGVLGRMAILLSSAGVILDTIDMAAR